MTLWWVRCNALLGVICGRIVVIAADKLIIQLDGERLSNLGHYHFESWLRSGQIGYVRDKKRVFGRRVGVDVYHEIEPT